MTLKIKYMYMWKGFQPKKFWLFSLLKEYYSEEIILSDNPNIIIYSVFCGKYRSITKKNPNFQMPIIKKPNISYIFVTGENVCSQRLADVNLTFNYGKRFNNMRVPFWLIHYLSIGSSGHDMGNFKIKDTDIMISKKNEGKKFCCFVYGNNVSYRNKFVQSLRKYKKIDCPGKAMHNMNGLKVDNKIEFQKNYRFCISYENSQRNGYTTEKILDAYKSGCIPIYWGSKTIKTDFNTETFINSNDFKTENELIEYIKKVDNDDELYNSYFNKPILSRSWIIQLSHIERFYKKIVNKIVNKIIN